METKNLLLGLLALVFAVGSAFASLSPDLTYDSVKITVYDCRSTAQLPCEDLGPIMCRVDVIVNDEVIATSRPVYEEVGCLQLRKSRSPVGYVIF